MARDDWAEGLGWSAAEERLFEDVAVNDSLLGDELFQQAFDIGWFSPDVDHSYREAAREYVVEWLDQEYGVEFDDVFDWDAWREQYG
jgi:hypothetical protein